VIQNAMQWSKRALALLILSAGLCGCISVFPKAKPSQLYRFANAAASLPAQAAPPGLAITRGGTNFPTDVAGDAILTVTGNQAAFIAGARWVEPASLQFDEALSSAFDAPGAPRLAGRGESFGVPATLRLEVRRFQADYDKGQGAAPTVEVQVRAILMRNSDRAVVGDKLFDIRQPADDNTVSAIVAAYGAAVSQTVGGIRDWATAGAAAIRP